MDISRALNFVETAISPPILLGIAAWNSDKVLSAEGAKRLYAQLFGIIDDSHRTNVQDVIDLYVGRYFSPRDGHFPFLCRVLLLTIASLLILLTIYTSRTDGLFEQLGDEGFLSQFFGNGFVVTYGTNLVAFALYDKLSPELVRGSLRRSALYVLVDLFIKVTVFLELTALTYILFAATRGAFGGSGMNALAAIGPTMTLALKFQDLTAVYLYSFLLSSFPLFVGMFLKLMFSSPALATGVSQLFFWLPFKEKPLRSVSVVFSVFVGVMSLLFSITLLWSQG